MNNSQQPMMSKEPEHKQADAAGLFDFFDRTILWKRKWSLVLSVLVAAALGAAYVQHEATIYEVTSRVVVQPERFATDKETLVRSDRTFLITQGEIVRSPVVVESALQSLLKKPSLKPDPAVTDAVMRSLRVTTVDDANVLRLAYRNEDATDAVNMLGAIVNSYQDYVKEMQHGSMGETLEALAQRDRELRGEIQRLEERYNELHQGSRVIGQGADAIRNHVAILEQLGTRLTAVKGQRIDKETRLQALVHAVHGLRSKEQLATLLVPTALRSDGRSGGDNLVDFSEIPLTPTALSAISASALGDIPSESDYVNGLFKDPIRIQERLWQAEAHATELRPTYGPLHPEMRAIQEQIALWRQRLEACEKAAPTVLAYELNALEESETDLTKLYETEYEKVKIVNASLMQEQQALADIQRVQSIHDATAKQLRELQLANEALTNGQVSIMVRMIEAPDATVKLVWPRPVPFIGLCAVLGLAFGCVVVSLAGRVTKQP